MNWFHGNKKIACYSIKKEEWLDNFIELLQGLNEEIQPVILEDNINQASDTDCLGESVVREVATGESKRTDT